MVLSVDFQQGGGAGLLAIMWVLQKSLLLLSSFDFISEATRSSHFYNFVLENTGKSAYAIKCKINVNCPKGQHIGY